MSYRKRDNDRDSNSNNCVANGIPTGILAGDEKRIGGMYQAKGWELLLAYFIPVYSHVIIPLPRNLVRSGTIILWVQKANPQDRL